MGLISRVSSRTYRPKMMLRQHFRKFAKNVNITSTLNCPTNLMMQNRHIFTSCQFLQEKTPETPPPAAEAEETAAEKVQKLHQQALDERDAVIEDLKKKHKERENHLLRQVADGVNTLKRREAKHEENMKFSNKPFAKDMLAVFDNIQRAIDHIDQKLVQEHDQVKQMVDGLHLTRSHLESTLGRHGVKKIEAAVGMPFDTSVHDAAFHLPAGSIPNTEPDQIGAITEVGWMLHDRVLRAAKVGVIQ